jgi:hypothetical protein
MSCILNKSTIGNYIVHGSKIQIQPQPSTSKTRIVAKKRAPYKFQIYKVRCTGPEHTPSIQSRIALKNTIFKIRRYASAIGAAGKQPAPKKAGMVGNEGAIQNAQAGILIGRNAGEVHATAALSGTRGLPAAVVRIPAGNDEAIEYRGGVCGRTKYHCIGIICAVAWHTYVAAQYSLVHRRPPRCR